MNISLVYGHTGVSKLETKVVKVPHKDAYQQELRIHSNRCIHSKPLRSIAYTQMTSPSTYM